MQSPLPRPGRLSTAKSKAQRAAGFTLAEAAITIAIVGLTLSATMQALQSAQITAGHNRNAKIARELGMTTLSEIATGRWWDEISSERNGSYAEQDYPEFSYELVVGDESFPDRDERGYDDDRHDSFLYREQLAEESEEDSDEETAQAFEKVQVRVTFPRMTERLENQITLERWIRWAQVYGPEEEEEGSSTLGNPGGGPGGGPGGEQ